MAKESMLTTHDNPYDPFEEFIPWLMYDKEKGYDSCERLARIVQPRLSSDMTQREIDVITECAIDEIIEYDPIGIYKKSSREVEDEEDNEEL